MRAVVVTVPASQAEVASDRLWALGVVAIEERATASGAVELWTSLGDELDSISPQVDAVGFPWRVEDVDERVADTWRDFAAPTWVADDIVVVPAWQPTPIVASETIAISIEPGSTFGMGDHPTTVLSMRALRAALTPGCTVLDVGCGSGVLAIAACRFGAAAAVGIDISPAAVPTTAANARRNGVADRVTVSGTPLADVDTSDGAPFDVVIANILAPVLIDLADDLLRVCAPSGTLIISGILTEHHQHVLDALRPMHVVRRDELSGWSAITLRR